MRRIYDPNQYEFLKPYQPMNTFISVSALLLGAAQLIFMFNFLWSLRRGREGAGEPLERELAGVDAAVPATARQLPDHAHRLSRALRVQRARPRGRLLAAERAPG